MSDNKQSNIEKEFAPYEESLKLKALEFDEPCFGFYERGKELVIQECEIRDFHFDSLQCVAPTFSQAFRWFREKYNKLSVIDHATGGWYFVIREIGGSTDPMLKAVCGSGLKSYEEAELACLRKLIEIVQGGNK